MKRLAIAGLAVALSAGAGAAAYAGCGGPAPAVRAPDAASALSPSLGRRAVVVRIHADWCPACRATQPTVDAIKAKYGKRIAFVEFDVTDDATSAVAELNAKRLGLAAFYEANKTATSTVAVFNPTTGVVVAKLYNDSDAVDYASAIDRVNAALKAK